jgi:iron complex outermembrane receptor protein
VLERLLLALLFTPPPTQVEEAPEPVAAEPACSIQWDAEVVEADAPEAIPDAQLVLRTPQRDEPIYVRSATDGSVSVEGLCPGTMQVSVSKSEHSSIDFSVELVAPSTRTTIELEPLHEHHSARVIVIHDEGPTHASASESLSGSELARARGQGLADTLSGISGVSTLRSTAGGMGKPIIRGQFGRRNLILVDGVRHEGQDWGIDHAPEVDPNSAGRITVIKGASTTRFGSDAIGGAVLLEPPPLPRQPSLNGEVGVVGFSNPLGGGGSARVDYAPLRGQGLALRVEGNLSRHRAALAPDYPLDNTGGWTWNTGARVGMLREAFDVELGYHLMRSRLGICTCLRIASPEEFESSIQRGRPINADLYTADFEIERPRQEIWHHLALARARIELGKAGELHAIYSFQFDDRQEFDIVRASITGPQLSFGLATHSGDLRYEHSGVHMREWTLVGTLGGGVGQQSNEFEGAASLIPDYRQWSWNVYDIERFVHERVELELGVRYEGLDRTASLSERDWLGQSAGGRLDDDTCREVQAGGGVCERSFHAPSATVGLLGRPLRRAPELTWRVQLDTSARIPAIDEQFMNGAAPSFPILGFGDAKIGIERAWGGESTVQYDGDWLFVEASGYASYIDNYIYFVPQPQTGQCAPLTCTTRGAFPVFVFEPTDALFGGGELRLDLIAPRLPLGLSGNAAWVRGRNLDTAQWLAFVPSDRYSLAGRWFWPDTRVSSNGYLELNGTVVARQRRVEPDLDYSAAPPTYVLLGAAVGVEFLAGDQLVRTSLVGTNLLNLRYRDYNSLLRYFADEPGWGLQLRVAIDFDVNLRREREPT